MRCMFKELLVGEVEPEVFKSEETQDPGLGQTIFSLTFEAILAKIYRRV